jgi:membrane protein
VSRARELADASRRAVRRMLKEHFTGSAAELSYYGLLSAVPCLAMLVALIGLIGSDPQTTNAIEKIATEGASGDAGAVARDAAQGVVDRDSRSGLALGAGLLTTMWVASMYVSAFRRTAYSVRRMDPGPQWRARPLQVLLTFAGLLALALAALALAVTQRIMSELGQALGAEDAIVTIWSIARWPLTLGVLMLLIAGLYDLGPDERRGLRALLSTGALAALVVWLIASTGFEIWVGTFANYDVTYGALAGVAAFAVWLWISNLALLFGLVLDAELAD